MTDNFLFNILNSINHTKEDLSEHVEFEKNYNPYIINKFIAGSMDTVFYAAELSKYKDLPKKMQYSYYRSAVRAKKRYTKWIKPTENLDLEKIASYFKCSQKEAKTYLAVLNDSDIKKITLMTSKGGRI